MHKRRTLNPFDRYRIVPDHPTYLVRADGYLIRLPEIVHGRDLRQARGAAPGTITLRKITKKAPLRILHIAYSSTTPQRKHPLCALAKDGVRTTYRAASIIASAWLEPSPSPTHVLAYADGDLTNLDPVNLRWTEPVQERQQRRAALVVKTGTRTKTAERNASLIAMHQRGLTDAEISAQTGIAASTVSRAIAPARKHPSRHVGARLDLSVVLRLYARKTTQADIARQLNVSRKVINKLIAKARRQGLIHLALAEPQAGDFRFPWSRGQRR
jgi:DNA-directed RNA polymerase specialized sigma24 family protein